MVFLTLRDVLEIHSDQVSRYGGQPGIRDLGLLASALAQPRATFGGAPLHRDLHQAAAAYLYHIVMNHAFVDGNKRTGAVCAIVFLSLNGLRLQAAEPLFEALVWRVASGKASKQEVAEFLARHTVAVLE